MDKYKKLAGNTVTFAIGSFGSKLLSFFLVRLYTGVLNKSEYGVTDLLYQTVNVLYPIVTFAMADAIIRFGLDKAYDKKKVYSIAMFSTLIGMSFLCLLSPLFNIIPQISQHGFLLYIYCYCCAFRNIAASFVRAKGYVKLFAADGIFSTFVIVSCNCIFLLGFKMGVAGYILSIIISDVISFLGLTFFASLHKYLDVKYIDKTLMKEMLKYSSPLISTYVLWWVTAASDRWFILKMLNADENGLYAAANKIPGLLLIITTLFFQAWQMSAIENKDSRELSGFYGKIFNAYTSVLFIAAAGLILIIKPFTFILVDSDFFIGYIYTAPLIVAVLFQCLCQFLSSIYNVKRKSVNSLWTALIAAVLNIILNVLLIPTFGCLGAAAATVAAYGVCYIIRIHDARKYLPFKVPHVKIIINFFILAYMPGIVFAEPFSLWWFVYIGLFLLLLAYNFKAVLSTAKRILKGK